MGEGYYYYNFRLHGIQRLRIITEGQVEYGNNLVTVKIPAQHTDKDKIRHHLEAISQGYTLLGNFIDVELVIPNYSIFYVFNAYTGKDRFILRFKSKINKRLGHTALTLRR